MSERYRARGVSPEKEDVHKAVENTDKGLFPTAFAKLLPDVLTGDPEWCVASHADTAGTKSVLAYLVWKESGEVSAFRGIAQDALMMNIDDLLCVGATGPFLVSNTIGRNAKLVDGSVLAEIIAGYEEQRRVFATWGIDLQLAGGETADVGDLVRTIDVGATVTTRMRRKDVIANDKVKPGDIIIGLASDGQAPWEHAYNSGIGCNGLTSARHDLLIKTYAEKYPETFEPGIDRKYVYSGTLRLEDTMPNMALTYAQLLLAPTRTYAPIIKPLLQTHRDKISALVHATGGGQTKILRTGQGLHYIKDQLFEPPVLFKVMQQVSQTSWREMYQVFNMGHRMEIVGPEELLPVVMELAMRYGIMAQQVGRVEASPDGENQVTLHTPGGVENYRLGQK